MADLTPAQLRALDALFVATTKGTPMRGVRTASLQALERHGLVESRFILGFGGGRSWPSHTWRLTPAGKAERDAALARGDL